jgi:hypothetical protein
MQLYAGLSFQNLSPVGFAFREEPTEKLEDEKDNRLAPWWS